MSQLTKRAIIDCTLSLAEKKSLRKITVRDIVSACGITRNTFYYYFHDIYDVIDQAIEEYVSALDQAGGEAEWEAAIFSAIEFVAVHKRVWQNLYRSVGHKEVSRFVMPRLHKVLMQNIEKLLGDRTIGDRELYIICSFYEEGLFGVMARWLVDSRSETTGEKLMADVKRIEAIFAGQLRLAVENAERYTAENPAGGS